MHKHVNFVQYVKTYYSFDMQVDSIYLDFRKAFDPVDHAIGKNTLSHTFASRSPFKQDPICPALRLRISKIPCLVGSSSGKQFGTVNVSLLR